jgi:hypothetical protein
MVKLAVMARNKKVVIPALILVAGIFVLGAYFFGFYLPQTRANASKWSVAVKASGAKISAGEMVVSIPASSLPTGSKVEVTRVGEKPPLGSGKSYASEIYSIGATAKPQGAVVIEIAFDPDKVEKTENLYAAWWDGGKWVPAEGVIDHQRNKLIVQANHFSRWAALYDRVSAIWEDKIEDVRWNDVPSELRDELSEDLGLGKGDFVAIEHVQFSSLTKAATFTIGIANQISDVSGILGGTESAGELAQALVEKIGEDVAKEGGGKAGELAVDVYEGFKTGYAEGGVVGHLVLKTGFATAQLQKAAPQILSYMLEKEMKHINDNTSGLFEYLSLYDSGTLDRIDTYVFFYDAKTPEQFRSKGVVLYYWSPSWKRWAKGKDISTTSDVLVKVFEREEGRTAEETPSSPESSGKTFRFSKESFPSDLIGYPFGRVQSVDPQAGSYESLSPLEQVQASYEKADGTDFIIVGVTKFDSSDKAKKGPEAAEEWARSNMGHSANLQSKASILGYPFLISVFSEGGPSVIVSSSAIVDEYLIDISIEKQGGTVKGTEAEYREVMSKVIEAFTNSP